MRLLRHIDEVPPEFRGSVVAIGNFDGVHRGHRVILARAADHARARGAPLAVLTFEPHPREFFAASAPPFRLTPLRTKARLLEAAGVDLMLAVPFDQELSRLGADDFIDRFLLAGLGVGHVVVGYDFAFGHKRGGNADLLRTAARRHGFRLDVIDPVGHDDEIYASTRIRDFLWQGRPRDAARLLGHWWEIEGHVRKGDRRGHEIGFPTANIGLEGYLQPAFGVYAARVRLADDPAGAWRSGVANLGRRPTFDKSEVLLEVHLFDFDQDLYGRGLRTALIDYLRPERKFAGLDALTAQIKTDAEQARHLLAGLAETDAAPVPT